MPRIKSNAVEIATEYILSKIEKLYKVLYFNKKRIKCYSKLKVHRQKFKDLTITEVLS